MDDNATVGTMGSTRSDIFALTEAILTQTAANATNFDNMLSLMQHKSVNFVQGRTPSGSNLHRFLQSIIVGRMDATLIRIRPVPNVNIQSKAIFLLLHGVINREGPIGI